MERNKFMQVNVYEAQGAAKKAKSPASVPSGDGASDQDYLRWKREFAIYKRDTDIALEELRTRINKLEGGSRAKSESSDGTTEE